MKVPATEVERDHAYAGLHQPAGQKEMLVVAGSAVPGVLGISLPVALPDPRIFLFQIQSLGQPGGGQYTECLLGEGVHLLQVVAQRSGSAERVESGEEGLTAVHADGIANRFHVGRGRTGRSERTMGNPEETGFAGGTVGWMPGLGGQADESRETLDPGAHQLGKAGSHAGPVAGRFRVGPVEEGRTRATGIAHEGIVASARCSDHSPNPRPLVHHLGHHGKGIVDVNARHVGADGTKDATDLLGRIGLRVDQVLMRGAPAM